VNIDLTSSGSVHVWTASIGEVLYPTAALASVLSCDEQTRASRYRVPDARVRFVVARSVLRLLLAAYIGVRPGELEFTADPCGKPRLRNSTLHFNVSHCGSAFAIAFAGRDIGVDVELVAAFDDRIASQVFSSKELHQVAMSSCLERRCAMAMTWTRKEALLKAVGCGLVLTPSEIDLGDLRTPAVIVLPPSVDAERRSWNVIDLERTPASSWVGAVAVPAGPMDLREFEIKDVCAGTTSDEIVSGLRWVATPARAAPDPSGARHVVTRVGASAAQ